MIKTISTSETSDNFYQTIKRDIPEDCNFHSRCREKLTYHKTKMFHTDGRTYKDASLVCVPKRSNIKSEAKNDLCG
jgi:hypothetical protein